MNKLSKVFLVIIIILIIALGIITKMYFDMKKSSQLGLESTLENANLLFEANKRIDQLEKLLETE